LTRADVVQVKAFIRPMGENAAAVREISASFDGTTPPPIVVVEWQSDLFTEIELVVAAHGRPAITGDTLAFSALPWLNKSPRYSHVVEVAAGTPLIFVGEMGGDETGDARAQLRTAFERAGSALFEAGGSFRTLRAAPASCGGGCKWAGGGRRRQ
jgi:enamine deaminase RidA (YjgF/YER057c/UK114 family)